jgi:hypothetical protein
MLIGLQFILALMLVAAMLKIGETVSNNIEDALGEKPLRDRPADER